MTSFSFRKVRRYKRGAYWESGEPRRCIGCSARNRRRRRQATVTAVLVRKTSKTSVPVAYCDLHLPEELR